MSVSQFHLNWNSHKNNICTGFTSLQQNEEFVDMTIAADGHLVNVHKCVFALASPYLKNIIKSSATPHPIIVFCNISYEVLNYILSYVYTGEVSVPVDKIQLFMKAAKDLHLLGLGSMGSTKVAPESVNETDAGKNILNPVSETVPNEVIINNIHLNIHDELDQLNATNSFEVNMNSNTESNNISYIATNVHNRSNERILNNSDNRESGMFTTVDGYQYRLEVPNEVNNCGANEIENSIDIDNDIPEIINMPKITITNDSLSVTNPDKISGASNSTAEVLYPKDIITKYTMSSRGSLQLILNRYMYYCHHQSQGGRKRRWRCIDYRGRQCPAFIDTTFEVMTTRKFVHSHPFHDEKILKKKKKGLIFTSLNCVIEMQNSLKKSKKI